MNKSDCPLTPALQQLLQACLDADTLSARLLAQRLHRSPNTIKTEFQRVSQLLHVRSRFSAVTLAYKRGWITMDLSTQPTQDIES